MSARNFSCTNALLFVSLLATFVGWFVDRDRLQNDRDKYKMLMGDYKERAELVGAYNWKKNENDSRKLLYLLTDPYPKVGLEAEKQLRRLYGDSKYLPEEGERTCVERINVWSQCILQEQADSPKVLMPQPNTKTGNAEPGVFDPDPFGDGS